MARKTAGTKRRQSDKNTFSPDVGSQPRRTPESDSVVQNYVHADPAYLETLGQTHSGWIFGAIAEIVDNSRDAKATKLEISIDTHHSNIHGEKIPMLSLNDDGHGMSHDELVVMLSLGNKKFHQDDRERIGKYGVGFKTGAMKLGRDVIVLTQTTESRSVAFLSQTYNEGNDDLELPIVSYRRIGSAMQLDTDIQSEMTADYNLDIMKRFSPFDTFYIGEKLALFGANGQGTQVYIWNLEKSGTEFSLEWHKSDDCDTDGDDIIIRSRRIRQRPWQLGQNVPLDYSLRAYLEVIYLDPRMKISIQGSVVKSRLVAKSLVRSQIMDGNIEGKPVQLIIGHCKQEWERLNSGIFLYWHGRLIEAYKRVGGRVQQPDNSRGVIGVVDVTDVMRVRNRDLVHNTKQAFQECFEYAKLEEWLGEKLDEYCLKKPGAKKAPRCSKKYSIGTVNVGLQMSEDDSDDSQGSEDDSDASQRSEDDSDASQGSEDDSDALQRSEDDSDANSERSHEVLNILNVSKVHTGSKLPAAKKSSNCARGRSTASTSNVVPNSERPHVVFNIPKVAKSNMGAKEPAAQKSSKCASTSNVIPEPPAPAVKISSTCARMNSTASTSNASSKLPAAAKKSIDCARRNSTSSINMGLQGREADLGFRKRFTRSSLCPPKPEK